MHLAHGVRKFTARAFLVCGLNKKLVRGYGTANSKQEAEQARCRCCCLGWDRLL